MASSQQMQKLTFLEKLGKQGQIDQKSQPQQDVLQRLGAWKTMQDMLSKVRDVRAEEPVNFVAGAGNEPGPFNIDVGPTWPITADQPEEAGFFDQQVGANLGSKEGLDQRARLEDAVNAMRIGSFALGGKALTKEEVANALMSIRPELDWPKEQFDARIKTGLENTIPTMIKSELDKLRQLGVGEDAINKFIQQGNLFNK